MRVSGVCGGDQCLLASCCTWHVGKDVGKTWVNQRPVKACLPPQPLLSCCLWLTGRDSLTWGGFCCFCRCRICAACGARKGHRSACCSSWGSCSRSGFIFMLSANQVPNQNIPGKESSLKGQNQDNGPVTTVMNYLKNRIRPPSPDRVREEIQQLPPKVQWGGKAGSAKVWCWKPVTRMGLSWAMGIVRRPQPTPEGWHIHSWRDASNSVSLTGRLIGCICISKLNSAGHCSSTVCTDKLLVHSCPRHSHRQWEHPDMLLGYYHGLGSFPQGSLDVATQLQSVGGFSTDMRLCMLVLVSQSGLRHV